jgi:hypothetical protein
MLLKIETMAIAYDRISIAFSSRDRFLDIAQICSVDRDRLLIKVGNLEEKYWGKILNAVHVVLDFA